MQRLLQVLAVHSFPLLSNSTFLYRWSTSVCLFILLLMGNGLVSFLPVVNKTAMDGGFPGSSNSKASAYNEGDLGLIPGSERSPGEGNGNPLQYSCLENPMDGGAWRLQSMGLQRVRHDWATSLHLTSAMDKQSCLWISLIRFLELLVSIFCSKHLWIELRS